MTEEVKARNTVKEGKLKLQQGLVSLASLSVAKQSSTTFYPSPHHFPRCCVRALSQQIMPMCMYIAFHHWPTPERWWYKLTLFKEISFFSRSHLFLLLGPQENRVSFAQSGFES